MLWTELKPRVGRFLKRVIRDHSQHSRLLNSISLMEHSGACQIGGYQRLGKTSTEVLRHAFEESRHAYFFRQQIKSLPVSPPDDYEASSLMAARPSRRYLRKLDLKVCRYLKSQGYFRDFSSGADLAYGFTTLLIELRADLVYRLYQQLLEEAGSKVSVRSIVAEEARHLEETKAGLRKSLGEQDYENHLAVLLEFEHLLFVDWLTAAEADLAGESIGFPHQTSVAGRQSQGYEIR